MFNIGLKIYSFRVRNHENIRLSSGHHHPHYTHHLRDSGHSSLGGSDFPGAPPLPPRCSCKTMINIIFEEKITMSIFNF